jgi:hypothetical protein
MSNERMKFHITNYSIEPVEDDRFTRLKMYVMHDGINKNGSDFPLSAIEDAEGSILDIPILAHIFESEEDFGEHEMEYDEETDKITYIEQKIGVIPSLKNNYHYEDIDGKRYVVVYGYIWNIYSADAVEIINRDQDIKISMEAILDDTKYDFKTKILNVKKFRYAGITLLGKRYGTGMYNTHAQIENFSSSGEFDSKVSELNNFLMTFSEKENEVKNVIENEILGEVQEDLSSNFAKDIFEETKEINKEVKSVPKKKEIAATFSLTSMQMYGELSRVLSEITYIGQDWMGNACERSKYYLRDFDANFVYVVDCMNDYMDMKIPYSMSGDNFALDCENASRIKYAPTDWDGANEDPDYNEEDEIVVMSLTKQIQDEGMAAIQTVKESMQAEFSLQLETKLSEKDAEKETEKQDAVFAINAKLEEKQVELEGLQSQLNELAEYKQFSIDSVRKEKVDSLFKAHVKHFKQEEIDELREKEPTFATFELFEKEFKSFAYDRIVQTFSETTSTKPLHTFMEIPEKTKQEQDDAPKSIWDKLD